MRKLYKYCLIVFIILVAVAGTWVGYSVISNKRLEKDIIESGVDMEVFRPYILGTKISFAEGGNSADFVKTSDGWGGQEPEHRCAVGTQTVMRLYIPEGSGTPLRIVMDGFGVYPVKTATYQKVTIFANDVEIGVWHVGLDGPFSMDIPSSVMVDNKLTLRFVPESPYSPPPDVRKLSMAVKEIKIDKIFGAQTKRKIGKWLKEKVMGGGVKQTYDTNMVKDEDWM